jgi:hypothetical protein
MCAFSPRCEQRADAGVADEEFIGEFTVSKGTET